ncbi:MAG: hybrid sensor histidine kinase/response regulator, partial [Planctomycetaceae bacterium]|nr:hybrid sensor histidine kinase/response regulator [Planctomycetaceae bacterium]
MWSLFLDLFDTQGFPKRWECGEGWSETPAWGWVHISADVITFLAYYAVPCIVLYFLAKQNRIRFPLVYHVFFALIFFSCGTVHLIEAGIFYWPVYRLSGVAKLVTA